MTELITIVDADSIVWGSCAVLKEDEPLEYALYNIKNTLQRIRDTTNCTMLIPVIGGSNNFRYEIYPEYKANRKQPKPKFFNEARNYIIDRWDAHVANGMEADDYVGIFNYSMKDKEDVEVIMAHIDKDLDMLEGRHYNYRNDVFYDTTEVEGWRFFYTQLLTGDNTDNIRGLFKIRGMKAMPKIKAPIQEMTDPEEMKEYVKSVYLDGAEDPEAVLEDMKLSAKLLWIKRRK